MSAGQTLGVTVGRDNAVVAASITRRIDTPSTTFPGEGSKEPLT